MAASDRIEIKVVYQDNKMEVSGKNLHRINGRVRRALDLQLGRKIEMARREAIREARRVEAEKERKRKEAEEAKARQEQETLERYRADVAEITNLEDLAKIEADTEDKVLLQVISEHREKLEAESASKSGEEGKEVEGS